MMMMPTRNSKQNCLSFKTTSRFLFAVLVSFLLLSAETQAQGVHTDSGYDTVGGEDAICWFAPPFRNQTVTTSDEFGEVDVTALEPENWRTPFVGSVDTMLATGSTEMLSACPLGMDVHMDVENPSGKRMRQFQPYNYHIYGSVNLTELRSLYRLDDEAFFYSDDGPQVVLRFIFCPMNGNLCSPFPRAKKKSNRLLSSINHDSNERSEKEDETHAYILSSRGARSWQHRDLQEVEQNNITRHKGANHTLDGSIIISKFYFKPINFTLTQAFFEFQHDVEFGFPFSGSYLPLGIMQFLIDNQTYTGSLASNATLLKFDAANLLHQRAQTYYEPMTIRTVSNAIEILTYVMIALAALVLVFLFGCTVYYRKEGVMKLSQGGFLMVLLLAGTMATCCSVLYNPKSNLYCYLQGPMTMIPLQFMLAIVLGRLRRIKTVMEPLMEWRKPQTNHQTNKRLKIWKREFMFSNYSSSSPTRTSRTTNSEGSDMQNSEPSTRVLRWRKILPKRKSRSLRQSYSAKHLWIVIILITIPMVVVEIVNLAVFRPDLVLDTNMDESVGRFECGTTRDQRFQIASIAVLLVTLFLAIYQANCSRNLPALFNEAESISSALVISLFVMALGFAVIFVADEPDTPPGLPYLFKVLIVCSIALLLSVKLLLPKLRIIWKGEKVVLSKMLAEHKKMTTPAQSQTQNYEMDVGALAATKQNVAKRKAEVTTETDQKDVNACYVKEQMQPTDYDEEQTSPKPEGKVGRFENNGQTLSEEEHLVIQSDVQPPSEVMTRVLGLSRTTSRMNERILSGLQVDRDDWKGLKQSMDELQGLLANVEYR